MFGERPQRNISSPLEKGDHLETDTLPFLDKKGTTQYQSLISLLQWAVALERFNVATAVMSILSFSMMPRDSHMTRVQFCTGVPNYDDVKEGDHD